MKYTHWPSSRSSSGSTNTHAHIHPFLLLNISMYTLAAICFMIYTTELNYAHAEGEEDLGSASASLGASVTVGTACNFSGNVDIPHTSTIMNGVNSTDIGKTTMNVTCNDQGGYAVYAIGYTNDEYGNTALKSSISDDYNIPTGTSTSGNTSNWSMKLATVPSTTTATIENGYNNYSAAPDDYTKVATLNTITNPGSSTTGSSISTTYQAYISPTQPAGTYSGKVKYTLVHPSTAPAPEKPLFMQDTAAIKQKLINTGDTMQATDSRDGKKYWITKLADGNIWMTQNLDLELDSSKTYTPADTDISANWQPARSTIEFTGSSVSGWSNTSYAPFSASPGELYVYTSGATTDDSQYTSLAACQAVHPDCSAHNHVGNYYNWSAAVASNYAGNMKSQFSNAPSSICPAGWRLPKVAGSYYTVSDSEFGSMLVAEGIITNPTGDSYATDGLNNIRISPLWLARSGYIYSGTLTQTGDMGSYWSSTVQRSESAYTLVFGPWDARPAATNFERGHGFSVRCLVK